VGEGLYAILLDFRHETEALDLILADAYLPEAAPAKAKGASGRTAGGRKRDPRGRLLSQVVGRRMGYGGADALNESASSATPLAPLAGFLRQDAGMKVVAFLENAECLFAARYAASGRVLGR
jgi:hypothetical protein